MELENLLVFGAGGYARCVVDAITAAGGSVRGVVDRAPQSGEKLLGVPVLSEDDILSAAGASAVSVAIGDNALRQRIVERIRATRPDFRFATVVHPRAVIASSAFVGEGAVILAGAVLNPMTKLGVQCSIYSNAVVEHDCELGDYVTLAPAAALGGDVKLGARTFIGLGAVVSHGVRIGDDAVIGAGSAVLSDQVGESVIVGSPARAIRTRRRGDAYL